MRVVKSVKQNHHASPEILGLLQDFRQMVNDCIRIGLDERITSMRKLSLACYGKLAAYDVPTCYRLTAISKAAGILSNYRKKLKANPDTKRPYAKRLVLADCYGFRIFDRLLKMLYRRGEYVFVILNDHTLKSISGHSARSITLTPDSLSICYSKEVVQIEPRGGMGIDCNLDNVTIAMTDGSVKKFDLSRATQVKQIYRQVKARFTRNDARIRKRIFGKYGSLQGNRVQHILHDASSRIVQRAKADGLAIVMENLKGIRKLYRKGNGQSKSYRAKLNSWSYHELQRQVEYKAKWEGLPVIYVAARGRLRIARYVEGRRSNLRMGTVSSAATTVEETSTGTRMRPGTY